MARRRRASRSPWDGLIVSLALVKVGQSIGHGGPVAEALRGLIDAVLAALQ